VKCWHADFDAALTDLRETELAIPSVYAPLKELSATFDWEGTPARAYPEANPDPDGGQYLIQHLRERAHHQGTDDALRDACDAWWTPTACRISARAPPGGTRTIPR